MDLIETKKNLRT